MLASKGGVAQLTKALPTNGPGRELHVNAIAPGYMRTDNTKALQQDETRNRQILERIPSGRWGEPSDFGWRGGLPGVGGQRLCER